MGGYYQKSIEEVLKELETSSQGLSNKEGLWRLRKYGLNKLKEVKKRPLIFKFFSQFKDLLAIILLSAALLAFLIGEPRDSLIILIIVSINALIGFVQEYKAERILTAFKRHLPSFSKIIRAGKPEKILTSHLVPGDILVLESGDAVGADALLIEAYELKTNDFSLTGESQPQPKKSYQIKEERVLTDVDNMVFMGTSVAEGTGKAVVVNTGMATGFGKIAKESQKIREEPTPLQKELIYTGKTVAKIASGVAVFALGLLYFVLGRDFKECLLFAIVAGAAMVPEGLPAAMSVALSLGAQRMLKKKALVKKLLHVESLGSTTVICTDKTGTLTTGEMTVTKTTTEKEDLFLKTLVLCNNASLDHKTIGDPLEVAFLDYTLKKDNYVRIRQQNSRVFEIPFSSKRKMMTVVCQDKENFSAHSKGACLEILERCQLSQKEKEEIIKENDKMAEEGLRVLAVAYKDLGKKRTKEAKEIEDNLIFLGLIGLEDPAREGVKEAIKLCRKAQIKVIMITGDYGLTALSIGRKIGLADEKTRYITGAELHQMDDDRLKNVLQKEIIFARIEPGQKLRIVKNLQEMGEVVAVTGDGVNDVPALVKADIGISMGKIGTDVAKESADMVLLDDNFATIVNAIKEGRRIFDNAKKFVFYVFSSNSGELFVPLFGVLIGLPLPLLAIQILAIDLGTDVFPSLALGVEKEESKIMEQPPRHKTGRIMSVSMLSHLLQIGLVMGILGLITYIFALYEGGWRYGEFLSSDSPLYFKATAAVYSTLVICQVANAFSCRSDKFSIFKLGIFSNIWLIYAEIISAIMLWLILYLKPLQETFRTAPPTLSVWLFVFLSFFIFLGIFERRKKRLAERK